MSRDRRAQPLRRWLLPLLGSAALAAALTTASVSGLRAQPAAADPFAQAEVAIRAEMARQSIPGSAVAVVVGNRVVWSQGFGVANVETGLPVTADTLFQIGSVTKTFTAAALLSANAQGVVDLGQPVSRYVSGLTSCVGAPTLTQLLSHTGGLIDEPDEFGPHGEDGLAAYPRTWTREYCMLPPGRAFSYSNSGFALAGLALQEADKRPFADVMRERVLQPLGMTRTTFRPTEAMTWPLAVGHRKDTAGQLEVVRPLANDARLWPAGTLYSSANEMARFVVALMNDGKVDGAQALPAGVARRMTNPAATVPAMSQEYGQGAFISHGRVRFGHGGTMTGYVAELAIRDERAMQAPQTRESVGVMVLTNGDGANPGPIVERALVAADEEIARRTGVRRVSFADGGPLEQRVLSEAQAERYTGTYRNPRRFTVAVVRSGATLTLKRFGRDFPMRAVETPDTFLVDLPRGGTEAIAFGVGADGRADYLQMNVWALARVTP